MMEKREIIRDGKHAKPKKREREKSLAIKERKKEKKTADLNYIERIIIERLVT